MVSNNFLTATVRSAAILTTSYVAGTTIEDCHRFNQIILGLFYTKGSLTSLEVKIEYSHDNTNFTQETASSISGGTDTLTILEHTFTGATANFEISIPILAPFVKVSFKGTGTVTNSSLSAIARLGTV